MYILKSYIVVPIISVVAMLTLATVFIPQVMTGEAIKNGPLLFGSPFPFIAQDFSRLDPPLGYVSRSGLGSPWELPIQKFYFRYFLIDILLISIPIFIPLFLAEILLELEVMKKKKRSV